MSHISLNPLTRAGSFTPPTQDLLQRKCACGNRTAGGGHCEECAKNKNSLQRQMRVGSSNDPLEHEADRVADQVVSQPMHQFSAIRQHQIQLAAKTLPITTIQRQSNSSTGPAISEIAKPPVVTLGQDKEGDIVVGADGVPSIGSTPKIPADVRKIPDKIKKLLSPDAESKKGSADCRGLQGFAPTTASQFEGSCCKGIASKENCCPPNRIGFKDISPRCCKTTESLVDGRCVEMKDKGMQPESEAQPEPSIFKFKNYEVPKPAPEGLKLTQPTFDYGYKLKPIFDKQFKLTLPEEKKKEDEKNKQGKKKKGDKTTIQKKLSIGSSNDPLEAEADRIADQVLANSVGSAPITSAISNVQRHSKAESEQTYDVPVSVNQTLSGSGKPLDKTIRADMESRFGHDFSQVRIHHGSTAEKSASDVNANAYTLGHNIVFGAGQFNPTSQSGKRLLAHELTHVVQQAGNTQGAIRRCANSAKNDPIYDKVASDIKKLPEYVSLPDKTFADQILIKAKTKNDCLYLLGKLKDLFAAKEKNVATITAETQASTVAETTKEATRVAKPEAAKNLDIEEKASADPARTWVKIKGKFGGGTYQVDRTNPKNIVVKAKVFLKAAGTGKPADVTNIKSMEDGIEKAASAKGFTVDIEFVNAPDAETFTAEVRPGEWEDATNWSGGSPTGFAHELLHMFAFEVDRYNYIDEHSKNTSMVINERLRWFLKQLDKPAGFDNDTSLMGRGQHPLDDDACTVAGLDKATCVAARSNP